MDNSTNKMSEKLVQYLDGELPAAEQQLLQEQLTADAALQQELENLQLAKALIRSYGTRNRVAAIHQQMITAAGTATQNTGSRPRIIRYSLAIAASIILIVLGIGTYQYYTLSADQLFTENYHSYELSTARDGATSATSPLEEAYRQKDFRRVTMIALERPFTTREEFLRAMAFTELKDDQQAIASYNAILEENKKAGTTLFNDEAEYYLALVYLRQKEYARSLALMTIIQHDPQHLYHSSITPALLQQVKRL